MTEPQRGLWKRKISAIAMVVGLILIAFLGWTRYVRHSFIHSGPGLTTGIIWRLRMIDAAKQEWALDHGQTNDVAISKADIAPYLKHMGVFPDGWVGSVAGERYSINTLWNVPVAELTREVDGRPKGTLFKLDQIILPNPS